MLWKGSPGSSPAGILEHCALPGTLEPQPTPAAPVSVHRHHLHHLHQFWIQRGQENQQTLSGFILFKILPGQTLLAGQPQAPQAEQVGSPCFGVPGSNPSSCIPTSLPVHVQPAGIPQPHPHRDPRDTRVIQARRAQQGFASQ